jgi:hypothetical protein
MRMPRLSLVSTALRGQLGGDGARRHGVDAHAVVGQRQRHHAGELVDATLADVVAGDGGDRQRAVDRAHVDDGPTGGAVSIPRVGRLAGHCAGHGLPHQKSALEVDAQDGVKVGFCHFEEISGLEHGHDGGD